MNKRLASVIIFFAALVGGALGWQPGEQGNGEDRRPQAFKYARGHKERPDDARTRQKRAKIHGGTLRRLYRTVAPPASYDARTKGFVPDVRDQGQCGSCWDFSGTGVVDVAYAVAGFAGGANAWVMSEQYTMDCGRNGGCNGDDNTTVLDWAEQTGLPLAKDYAPYSARRGRCQLPANVKLNKIDTWGYCDPNGGQGITSAAYIKASILQYGAVGCAVAAGNGWDSYSGGVYQGSGNRGINHDVMLVGWDDTKSRTPGKTVWIMRNSWGTGWGEAGYMRIAEGADMIGTQSVWASVTGPTPPPPPPPPPPPGPPPPPPPMPGTFWSGTITYQDGMITTIVPTPNQRGKR